MERAPGSTERKPLLALVVAVAFVVMIIIVAVQIKAPTEAPAGRFGAPLYVDHNSRAAQEIGRSSDLAPDEEVALEVLAEQPTAVWIAGPTRQVRQQVSAVVSAASRHEAVAVLVAYNIPNRDCGGHSASGERIDASDYREWIEEFAAGLAEHRAIVILEPDAIALQNCLTQETRTERAELLRFAVQRLSSNGSWVYIDAGHGGWLSPGVAAERLELAGVHRAAGFALNVSSFNATAIEIEYGSAISRALGRDVPFVVDTSRNGGNVPPHEWCNPAGARIGTAPSTVTGSPLVDAYLWVKTPGVSDGECNGGPPAGEWWMDYAVELVKTAPVE